MRQYVMLLNRAKDKDWTQEGVYVSFNPDLANKHGWSTTFPKSKPVIEAIAEQVGIRVADRIDLPPRQATLVPPPAELHEDVRAYLSGH